ncbi:non-specific lipid-transfer protein-like protein At2g13820 [Momordica charantia]|uniref:Non-specific lipid-transfer protein-like protein At2g13820 n=1 Tax=Momordica charantia TaxID=3673 RepID=A0A6J1C5K8_MOMCH|nr:non-specific lipid-transfer protein-like protein At2g13820 [Momordica charantia]
MASATFLPFLLLIISSHIFVVFSEDRDWIVVGHQAGQLPPCIQKILPCQPFIKPPSNPSPACCVPLKEMLADDPNCLCSFFDNAQLLKGLNVTQSDALKLPAACGGKADTSKCADAGASPPTASTDAPPRPYPPPPPPPVPTTSNDSSSSSKPNSSTKKNPAYGLAAASSSFVGLLLVSSFL